MNSGLSVERRFERYVAIGDSSTEGLDDPDGEGAYRGWANRLAERIALAQVAQQAGQGGLLYANLGVRGRTTREIRDQQLARAVAMRPDLVTLFSGTNDVVSRSFDLRSVASDLEEMQGTLTRSGATVLTFTLPDLAPVMPLARRLRDELAWGGNYLFPWLFRHLLGRSSGDRREAKRPELTEVLLSPPR